VKSKIRYWLTRSLTIAIIAAGLIAGVSMHSPQAKASGALTNISVTVTTDMCPRGGSVHRVNVTITTPGTAGSNWTGDTVSGLLAFYGQDLVQGSNFCQTSWWGAGYYWYWSVYRWFSFSGEHMYV
jgi:hypothetical protein